MSEEDSEVILRQIQMLTDDVLAYQDGQVIIVKSFETHRHVGQTLVAELINSSKTVHINIGSAVEGRKITNRTLPMNSDGIIEIYIDPDNTLQMEGNHYTRVSSNKNDILVFDKESMSGDNTYEEFKEYIILGHELVHAWRQIRGLFISSTDDNF